MQFEINACIGDLLAVQHTNPTRTFQKLIPRQDLIIKAKGEVAMNMEMLAIAKAMITDQYRNHEIDAAAFASLTEDIKLSEMRLSR